jgi:hypothetical protein
VRARKRNKRKEGTQPKNDQNGKVVVSGQEGMYTMLIPADSKDGQRQAWLSDVFLKACVYHVHYMLKSEADPAHYPVGAAALMAAAVSTLIYYLNVDLSQH